VHADAGRIPGARERRITPVTRHQEIPPPLTAPGAERTITLQGAAVPYKVRVSPRARVLRLVIHPDRGLEVVTPHGTSHARIEQVLGQKAGWVLRTLERVSREAVALPPLCSGRTLPYAGRTLSLVIRASASLGRAHVSLSGDVLTVTTGDLSARAVRPVLEAWYRRQARDVIAQRLAVGNAAYGFTYGRVTIKEQKSRWGSCSRQGNLNFNWRLLLAPLPVLDYVVVHELCHLKELNHSPRFWQLVARASPEYQRHRAWLRQHGRELRF
jgi:predicted metal-dependent hydrolase